MRRFATAAEQNYIPKFIDESFFGKSETSVVKDKFANLRENSQENQQIIARSTSSYERDKKSVIPEQTWAVERPAEVYQTRSLRGVNEDMSNVSVYDASPNSIRRASYDTDDQLNRSRSLSEILNENNYANLTHLMGSGDNVRAELGRHASIFGTTLEEIEEICAEKMDQHLQQFDRRTAMEKKSNNHEVWEKEQMTKLASARRPDIVNASVALRIGEGEYIDSAFGLPNFTSIDRNEAQRLKMVNERRAESLSIKRNGKSPKQRRVENHNSWQEEKTNDMQKSFQNVSASWLDRHFETMMEKD